MSSSPATEDTMTDISTTTATNIRQVDLPQQGRPRRTVGASLGAFFGLIGDAYKMAYVDPYTGLRRQLQTIPDDEIAGRDPSW
jgi:hypothetical protein